MKIQFALTGASGLVGSNLLWEIIKSHLSDLESVRIFVFGRSNMGFPLSSRIGQLLRDYGLDYITENNERREVILNSFHRFCRFIDFDLVNDQQVIPADQWSELTSSPIDFFFHVAANTDLRHGSLVDDNIRQTNIYGTANLLKLVSRLRVGVLSYVGTAYSCGYSAGVMFPDRLVEGQGFRNAYERSKLTAEVMVRDYCRSHNLQARFFRPSVVGGRLLEQPFGCVHKFDVFYGWAAFFLSLKINRLGSLDKVYNETVDLNMRITYNKGGGLNIVPVDFVAKALLLLTVTAQTSDSFHLVSRNELPHDQYIPLMLRTVNVTGVTHSDTQPTGLNISEKLYYRTVGRILTPYISSDPIDFDVSNCEDKLHRHGVPVPVMDIEKFTLLMDYAKERHFGLS